MAKKRKKTAPKRKPRWFVAEWLVYKGLRQRDVVERTDMTKGMVSEYVNGERRFNEDTLYAFAHAIGCEPADLLRPPDRSRSELETLITSLSAERQRQAIAVIRALSSGGKAA